MPQKALFILGNQLFPAKYIKQINPDFIFMAEDYGLCTHYKYHKHKIIFFLASMRRYCEQLKKSKYKVSYYDSKDALFKKSYEDKISDFLKKNKISEAYFYEIEDKFFETRIQAFFKKQKISLNIIQTPLFLTSRADFKDYLRNSKKPFMKTFYEAQRKKFGILIDDNNKPTAGAWSFDKDNRKKLPKKMEVPKIPEIKKDALLQQTIDDVDKLFADHPGRGEDFWLPTDRKQSLKWLKDFVELRLQSFGDYQDAITQRSDFVFHSVLSPMINVGLILPEEVLSTVEDAYHSESDSAPINAVEGFVRQVLGWREFVRGIYQNFGEKQWNENFWDHQRKLASCWYTGDTGLPVLDDAIKKADKYSYNHHIERLMVVSNMMLLSEVHPHDVYKWFMEMFSDSSDWVMGPNVFGMGQFSDGGIFATKPYTCGSNYYLKMGDYSKGDWCETVDGLYWRFIDKHRDFYKKNPRMSFMLGTLDKMDSERKTRIFEKADAFINKTTTV